MPPGFGKTMDDNNNTILSGASPVIGHNFAFELSVVDKVHSRYRVKRRGKKPRVELEAGDMPLGA